MRKQVNCKGCGKRLFDTVGGNYNGIIVKCTRSSCRETHTYQSEEKHIKSKV